MITRTGVAVAVAGATLLLAGTWADYPELVMLGLACAAALLVAGGWLLARPRLAVAREISPSRVPEGSSASAVLTVSNTGRRRSPPLLVTEAVAGRHIEVPLPSLAAGETFGTAYPLPAHRRGRYVIPALSIGHTDPLRLLHTGRSRGGAAELYVHPRVQHIAPMPLGGPRDLEGSTSASSPQGGVAFHSLRDYEPGDDWRRIHWKSTARTGTLMVRHNVIPDEPHQLVILDTSAAPYTGDSFEEAVRVAASVCAAAGRSGFPLACRTTADPSVAVESSTPQWDDAATAALDLLAVVRSSATDRGLSALPELVRDVVTSVEGVALTVVTGHADAGQLEILTAVRAVFLTVSLIRVGRMDPVVLDGVLSVDAPTATEFAARWNQLVPL